MRPMRSRSVGATYRGSGAVTLTSSSGALCATLGAMGVDGAMGGVCCATSTDETAAIASTAVAGRALRAGP